MSSGTTDERVTAGLERFESTLQIGRQPCDLTGAVANVEQPVRMGQLSLQGFKLLLQKVQFGFQAGSQRISIIKGCIGP